MNNNRIFAILALVFLIIVPIIWGIVRVWQGYLFFAGFVLLWYLILAIVFFATIYAILWCFFRKCLTDEYDDSMGKRNKAKYDQLVQEAFKQTPSGRQTIEYFPRLCDNKVKWDPNSGYLSIKMLHCL